MRRQKWEYLTIYVDFQEREIDVDREELDRYGDDGWELVHVKESTSNGEHLCVFKRPVEDDA